MSKPKEYSWMTKDKIMLYTFIALVVLAAITAILWAPVTPFDPLNNAQYLNLGLTVVINCIIAVGIAVGMDALLYKAAADSPLNTMSAAVFGMIVALSYTLGIPAMAGAEESMLPLVAPQCFFYVGLISLLGLVGFKKLQGLAGRKFVNPAATAKLLVLLPFLYVVFLPKDHSADIPTLATSLGYTGPYNGATSFGAFVRFCFSNPNEIHTITVVNQQTPSFTPSDVFNLMFLEKFHGWTGGASALAVIIVGVALFVILRRYIKWRVTLSYLVTTIVMSMIMFGIYGGDPALRLMFELFIGSSIFLAFFMATDPATSPITYTGQIIFGAGIAVIAVLLQTFANFFGGSLVALIIMNLTVPFLDKVGKRKPIEGGTEPKLPKAMIFKKVKTTSCMRCGACMTVCCNKLSPILIKQARDKNDIKELMKLDADFCAGCGHCNYVCPARIDLKSTVLNYPMTAEDEQSIEQNYLQGTSEPNIGVYSEMFSAKSTYAGQDGGVATALLVSGMQKGLFDAAIVVKRTEGYKSEAYVAESVDDIVKASGTKYMRVRLMSKLGELVAKGKRKIAIVGTPCEIRAARRIQQQLIMDCPDLELTMIGLFCFEDFSYPILKTEIQRLLNVDLDKAEKTQITKGKFLVYVEGKEYSIPVKELSAAVDNGCLSCPDFANRLADVSVGSVGSGDGRSTVIVRSAIGEKLIEGLDLNKGEVKKEEVAKLAALKKKRADSNDSTPE
jgi:F420H2:quinone oxidoreductase subunit F